jgi:predicted TIM-barrel fold metal-dependent hydrolase
MPVVDAHAHIYPSKIAAKAAQSVSDYYTLPRFGEGTPEHLLSAVKDSPITHFIVHSVALKPSNVETINTFIAEQCRAHPEFVGFGTMHQDYEDMEAEVERAIGLGLRGFKIHPDTQECNIDDPRFMKLYEIIEGRLPITVHTGDYRYDYSHPRRMKRVLKAFPNLVVDAAHLGGWSMYDIGYDWLGSESCYVDTSSCLRLIGERRLREFINLYGTDRVMFGSDYPLFNPAEEIQALLTGLSDEVFEKITWRNAERFTNVKIG